MKEYTLFIRDDCWNVNANDFDIDSELKKVGAFTQDSLKKGAINFIEKLQRGDLIHVVTKSDHRIRYTLTVANIFMDTETARLCWFDEYESGIPISYVEELFKLSKQKNFDQVDGLYFRIHTRGMRKGGLFKIAPTKRERELLDKHLT